MQVSKQHTLKKEKLLNMASCPSVCPSVCPSAGWGESSSKPPVRNLWWGWNSDIFQSYNQSACDREITTFSPEQSVSPSVRPSVWGWHQQTEARRSCCLCWRHTLEDHLSRFYTLDTFKPCSASGFLGPGTTGGWGVLGFGENVHRVPPGGSLVRR